MSENDAPERIWISKYSGQRVRASEGALVDGIQEYVRADLAAPDAAAAEIESEKQFYFWLNNHWPDWSKSENHQGAIELMRDAWSAALRLARFDTLAHKGALNYIVELEKSQALTYRMARHIRNTDEVPVARWGVDGMNLLAELRDLNPEQYDAEVKGPTPIYADAVRQARRETRTEKDAEDAAKEIV